MLGKISREGEMDKNQAFGRKKYDCVFSLGEACYCAKYLQKMHLRRFSAPLDWVAGVSFSGRIDFLLDGFAGYINKGDLNLIGQRDYPEPCDIYQNTRTGMIFNHDFPLNKNLDESYPAVREKYDRRINNLYRRLAEAQSVLIVYMELVETPSAIGSSEELVTQMNRLKEKFPDKEINLMYIRHNEALPDGGFTIDRVAPDICLAECYNRRRKNYSPTGGNYDNVRKIFRGLSSRGKPLDTFKYELRRFVHNFGKIIWRHKIKDGREYIRILGIKCPLNNKKP